MLNRGTEDHPHPTPLSLFFQGGGEGANVPSATENIVLIPLSKLKPKVCRLEDHLFLSFFSTYRKVDGLLWSG
jgi:hypothetical protein